MRQRVCFARCRRYLFQLFHRLIAWNRPHLGEESWSQIPLREPSYWIGFFYSSVSSSPWERIGLELETEDLTVFYLVFLCLKANAALPTG